MRSTIMLLPVDPTMMKHNPNFEILYNDIRTRKLTVQGATRDTKKQRIHDEIHKVRLTDPQSNSRGFIRYL